MNKKLLPYGRHSVSEEDIRAVVEVLRSDWLTTGPKIAEFEQQIAEFVGVKEGVAVNSGTAALHCAMFAAGIGPGDEVIVPPLTFAATANCILYMGGRPVFADIEPDTLLLDPAEVEKKITDKTKAVIAVDYAGQPCDYDALRAITDRHGLLLIADSCHALGARYKDRPIGSLADLTCFSFHPVKHITTGEGGMVVTDNPDFAEPIRRFRNHGITTDHRQRSERGTWYYEMTDLGFNYRITDFQCALGISQLKRLQEWVSRRREIAASYDRVFVDVDAVQMVRIRPDAYHAYHLYPILLRLEKLNISRTILFQELVSAGIGVNVHYIPVHLHPYYRRRFQTGAGNCPHAEQRYEQLLSLPMFPAMRDDDVEFVIQQITQVIRKNQR
ncbi:MAG: UDP-4-amino-4,6-dideoxy-N-acetyl-beta-L-altrosamine transaminase [Candidatus Omnitrophota bacterium]|jgi:perosamine synthetase|nr:MAG: UDP-4-amino-4,6-dideoxy-N-acetyl-beta-L-altrosamine transaminase [Candidatus Omnitrophota bacterium]